ncbi:LysR family transcriptional regulator [Comamonas piscis]
MDDFNDLYYFAAVVRHNGFSAASRATGVDKTRLSRRVAELERRLGVRLLQRSTRRLALTEAGERFFMACATAVDGAEAAYESMAAMQTEPAGTVRLSCPVVMAQSYIAPILPSYLARYPKVKVFLEATDRTVNLIEERFDLVLRARPHIDADGGMVVKTLGTAPRILVASPAFVEANGAPSCLEDLSGYEVVGQLSDQTDGSIVWRLSDSDGKTFGVKPSCRLLSSDLRVLHQAALHGIGIALMPQPIVNEALHSRALVQVLPEWTASEHVLQLVYPPPRGMLPSVRSLIDHLASHLPSAIKGLRS